ncbi:MAG TPA: cellulose synthase catalytic subunit [Candidatus Paceibacterota bacterium]|nr:cellulose synthase catalytic subunit [Candidatus Paceibacterota bacterium]
MLPDPEKLNKYLYIEKTPTWRVRAIYSFGIFAWLCVVYGFAQVIGIDPFYTWFDGPLVFLFSIYTLSSFALNLTYKQFDIKKHNTVLHEYWAAHHVEPSLDVFLPICGEDLDILENTWLHVSRLNYANKKVYVLDDSKELQSEHKRLAEKYGFTYLERPNKGEMKKAGNLKYGYQHSSGEFILILDADFAPRHDLVHELLPYMANPKIAIVQSPQYFGAGVHLKGRTNLEYTAAYAEEPFYRFIQVTRDRFDASICCGSNAIYRRKALEEIGGPVQVEQSEDARTGFAVSSKGWKVRYVPIILAIGLCPDDTHAYFHQQHRWCTGSMQLMLSKEFWQAPVPWSMKFCYCTGFMFYLHFPLTILFSFQLFWALFFYNQYISIANAILFYPNVLFIIFYFSFFPLVRFRFGYLRTMLTQTYAYSHAVVSAFLNNAVGWIPTNSKRSVVSKAFHQATWAISIYVFIYSMLLALAVRSQKVHVFSYNYYSVQFWLFFNLTISCFLLWEMYRTMERSYEERVAQNALSKTDFLRWQLKTAGLYTVLLTAVFMGIVWL